MHYIVRLAAPIRRGEMLALTAENLYMYHGRHRWRQMTFA